MVGEPGQRGRLVEEVEAVYDWIEQRLRHDSARAGNCDACGACKKVCPTDAIEGVKKEEVHRIIEEKCTSCGACRTVCPKDAVYPI